MTPATPHMDVGSGDRQTNGFAGVVSLYVLAIGKTHVAEIGMYLCESAANPRLHRRAICLRRDEAQLHSVVAQHHLDIVHALLVDAVKDRDAVERISVPEDDDVVDTAGDLRKTCDVAVRQALSAGDRITDLIADLWNVALIKGCHEHGVFVVLGSPRLHVIQIAVPVETERRPP